MKILRINILNFKKTLPWILILFLVSSYFFGFFVKEIHGASNSDAISHTWPAIDFFNRNDFFIALDKYGFFGENSYPLHHIIYGKILNLNSVNVFLTITTFGKGLVIFLLLHNIINLRYNFNYSLSLFFSGLILLSPYFRGSAYWALTENTGYFFLIVSILFFNKLENKENFTNLFFTCLFSSLAVYARPQLIFITIFYYIYLILSLKEKREKFFFTLIYFIMTIPGIFLIIYWKGFTSNPDGQNDLGYLLSIENIPQTFLVITSLAAVYIFPFFYAEQYSVLKKINKANMIFKIIISIIFVSFLYKYFNINIFKLSDQPFQVYGQGFVIRILYNLTSIEYLFLPISGFGLYLICFYFWKTFKNKIIILSLLLIFTLRVHFFSEYLDPLLFIIFFTLIDHSKEFKKNIKKSNLILFFFFYYLAIYSGSIYF